MFTEYGTVKAKRFYKGLSSDGNYFKLNLSNWEVDRVYKIEFKVVIDGTPQFFDEDYTFSVIG